MSVKKTTYNYMKWFSADEMHERSKRWLSELSFIRDEQGFLDNLIKSFAIKPSQQEEFGRINDFKNAIAENRRRLNPIFKQVQKHMNQLGIMLDGVNQLEMEKGYKKTHEKLYQKMNIYLLDYRTVKERGFSKLLSILKKEKQQVGMSNPDYKVKTIK
ncbi:MAG: hypothetical protein RIB64_04340 [Arenibacter algicola]